MFRADQPLRPCNPHSCRQAIPRRSPLPVEHRRRQTSHDHSAKALELEDVDVEQSEQQRGGWEEFLALSPDRFLRSFI